MIVDNLQRYRSLKTREPHLFRLLICSCYSYESIIHIILSYFLTSLTIPSFVFSYKMSTPRMIMKFLTVLIGVVSLRKDT